MLEFTGERVVPGEVEPDLWNEHVSRYRFAARLAASHVVADLGCGTGYGSAILAETAAFVHGSDRSGDAIAWASERYRASNLRFAVADCSAVPLDNRTAGLVVAFELIEHLSNPDSMLTEARRILSPEGLFCVSTPNAAYYDASRGDTGPNPFHVREYSLEEFRGLLMGHFPSVAMFAQNHTPAISFQSLERHGAVDAQIGGESADHANFYVAVCSHRPLTDFASFVYVPSSGNVLRERETHIARLEGELRQKQVWLDRSLAEHSLLLETHRRLREQLEQANEWAKRRDADFAEKAAHVESLLAEVEQLKSLTSALARRIESAEAEIENRSLWALDLQRELDAKSADLVRALEMLQTAESDRDRRTEWALSLDAERRALLAQIETASHSRWIRLGRTFHVGPKLAP